MTRLPPLKEKPRTQLRGIIGLPIWYPGFIDFRDWRAFFIRLEEHLRLHRFGADLLFYGLPGETPMALLDRLLARNHDGVVWFCADPTTRHMLLSLHDVGIPVMTVANEGAEDKPRYLLERSTAARKGLAEWRREGIHTVEVPIPASRADNRSALIVALKQSGMRIVFVPDKPGSRFTDQLDELGRTPKTGVLFEDDFRQHAVCQNAPEAYIELLERTRVMVWRYIETSSGPLSTAPTDVISMDWDAIAATIAADIGHGRMAVDSPTKIFKATWRPRMPLDAVNALSQSFQEPSPTP